MCALCSLSLNFCWKPRPGEGGTCALLQQRSRGAPAVGHARKHFGAMVSASKGMTEAAEVMEIVK